MDFGLQYYAVPNLADSLAPDLAERYGVSDGFIKPYPGFRAGAGYEWRHFRFSLETGYTYIEGTNPLVLDIRFVPLLCRASYEFAPWKNLSLVPSLAAGVVFAEVKHYETVIAMLLKQQLRSLNTGLLMNAGLRAGWSFLPALTLYAGAGLDCIVESGGLIPLPTLEVGITIKPFLFGKIRTEPASLEEPQPAVEEEEEAPPSEPETVPAVITEPDPEPVKIPEPEEPVRIVRILHFPVDRAVPLDSHLTELDAAAELLRSSPELSVCLRGYTAPYGTPGGRRALSEARARFCETYLIQKHGIEHERIRVEWYGADQEPEAAGEDWRRRCVEIIMEPVSPAETDPEAGTAIPAEGGE